MLPIIDFNEPFDFQKQGNFSNLKLGIPFYMQNGKVSFHYDIYGGQEITTFELRKVEKYLNKIKIISTTDLIADKPYRTGSAHYELILLIDDIFKEGLYYFYISDGNNKNKSEFFCIKKQQITINGDFSDDFSDDFSN